MQWPQEITDAFSEAIDIDLMPGVTKGMAVQYLLDETARIAVQQAQGNPARLESTYRTPFTPVGQVTTHFDTTKAKSITLNPSWHSAVERLYTFVSKHPQPICERFKILTST